MAANMLAETGLVYDIAGAILLGWAVVSSTKSKMAALASTAWGYNKHLIPAIVEQRNDGIVGLVLLVVGFGLQSRSLWENPEGNVFLFGIGILAVVLGGYFLVRRRLVVRGTNAVVDILEAKVRAVTPASGE
jgi:hypothetical protein